MATPNLTPRQLMLMFAGSPSPDADYPMENNETQINAQIDLGDVRYKLTVTRENVPAAEENKE